jgi:hypothetical protein
MGSGYFGRWFVLFMLSSVFTWAAAFGAEEVPVVGSKEEPNQLLITIGGKPFATYVYSDSNIPRPYFAHVRAPCGTQVTRNHPPVEGKDPTDHATYHPGIWLTFGDMSGNDYWRLKAKVIQDLWFGPPKGGPGRGTLTLRNSYLSAAEDRVVCQETCRYTILVRPFGYLLLWDSTFESNDADFYFGDQEEMGLGVRVATPISVHKGGHITDSEGRRDEKQVWGKQADWCDYSGVIDGRRVGITIMPHPGNFRRCWYHARDYGLLVANPFGQNAMTGGERSKVVVRKGEKFRLRYGVLVYSVPVGAKADAQEAYRDYLEILAAGGQQ